MSGNSEETQEDGEVDCLEEDESDDTKGVVISANLLDDIYSDCSLDKSEMKKSGVEDENKLKGPKFDPPVYIQRYNKVVELVTKYKARKVLDFGCAECKLLRKLKGLDFVEEIVGVDIDKVLLEENNRRLEPLNTDYLFRRERPLKISLLEGSIAETDDRFVKFDLVSCIEIIEHLDPPILSAIPQTVFGNMSPQVVIVTTPNSEFNVLFPDFSGFRHWDHRFEWTRAEFEDWANDVAKSFGYSVSFEGIGQGPKGTEHLGCCSQMALFEKNCDEDFSVKEEYGQPYTLVKEIHFPYDENPLSLEEKVILETLHYVWYLSCGEEELELTGQMQIPLVKVFNNNRIKKLCDTLETLRTILDNSDEILLNEDKNAVIYKRKPLDDIDDNDGDDWGVDIGDDERSPWNSECIEENDSGECWD